MPMMLIYWEEVYIPYIKENESLLVASKENVLEVNADKTKYMVMSQDQTAWRSHSMKIDNSCFERVEQYRNQTT
jgi:hypothetical protein